MADFYDDNPDFEQASERDESTEQAAAFEAELARQVTLIPPELYDTFKPLMLLGSMANYMLLGHPTDPVPTALQELLGYDIDAVQNVTAAHDTPSLARVMAQHTLEFFDFVLVSRLVFESSLDAPLRAYLTRHHTAGDEDDFSDSRQYLLTFSESLLANLSQYLISADEEWGEELRMRRLQTESIFARLDDTLRPFYPPGSSPEDEHALALDQADEAEDQQEAAVHVVFNQAQRITLVAALRLPPLLAALDETPFARSLAGAKRLRPKALERLAARIATSNTEEPFALAWSEVLRLYQAAQVYALSTIADVVAAGSLEDVVRRTTHHETPEEASEYARRTREMMTSVVTSFIEAVEHNHADDNELAEARAEISQLAELLAE